MQWFPRYALRIAPLALTLIAILFTVAVRADTVIE